MMTVMETRRAAHTLLVKYKRDIMAEGTHNGDLARFYSHGTFREYTVDVTDLDEETWFARMADDLDTFLRIVRSLQDLRREELFAVGDRKGYLVLTIRRKRDRAQEALVHAAVRLLDSPCFDYTRVDEFCNRCASQRPCKRMRV